MRFTHQVPHTSREIPATSASRPHGVVSSIRKGSASSACPIAIPTSGSRASSRAGAGEFGGKSAAVLLRGSQRRGDLSHGCRKARSMVFGDLPANGQRTKTATSGLVRIEFQRIGYLVARPRGGE